MYMLNMVIIFIVMYCNVVTAIDKIPTYLLRFNSFKTHTGHPFSRSRSGDSSPPQTIAINPGNNSKNRCGRFIFLSPAFPSGTSSNSDVTSLYLEHAQWPTRSMSSQHRTTSINDSFQGASILL